MRSTFFAVAVRVAPLAALLVVASAGCKWGG
jgi:hypothetical protein